MSNDDTTASAPAASPTTASAKPTAIDLHPIPLEHEKDVSVLAALIADGAIDPAEIVAVTGKVEGNTPGENSRGNAMAAVRDLLADDGRLTADEIATIPFVLSSGGVGIIAPQLSVYTRSPWTGPLGESRLTLGTALSRPIPPEWVGHRGLIDEVAATVRTAADRAGISAADARYVLTKNPGVTSADNAAAAERGVTIEPFERENAAPRTTGGSALGIAVATEGITPPPDAAIGVDGSIFSPIASCSAGNESRSAQVVLLGNSARAGGHLRVGSSTMTDILDVTALHRALREAGVDVTDGLPLTADERGRVKALYVKVGTPIDGRLRGRRQVTTNPAYCNELKAAVAGAFASQLGDTVMYISNAAFHQGPEGGGTVAVIVSDR